MNQLDIKSIRKKLKLTQEQFAEKIGVDFCTVNRWENGHFKPSKLALKGIQNCLRSMAKKVEKRS
ncbi:MAG: helix-turn-helix domain-containing protein [Candidatus Omnitrophota bacterium]|nr:helix-turn-helix domain-containing protein [Candidatus Omnitrophota bacterium]